MPPASPLSDLALAIVRAVHDLTEGRRHTGYWVSVDAVVKATEADGDQMATALQSAVEANLLRISDGPAPYSLCLTIEGLILAEKE